ncbi:hypothetical protein CBP31_13245 [Oceanisphaera profunda]|uniref:DUF2726 domain-containing protein n=1 Tax=Oceanisphaera profunda TaxID=1416627 RepID=A0A1Y0D7E1_9GAMM|nr:DUF2726 domain-containing protein [Oceanisphaera profunda]ART83468.1 hypothetical protein CBP31_13245 [Oceanisphaera profunda]
MIKIPPVSMLDWLIFIAVAVVSLLVLMAVLKRIWRGPQQQPYQQKLLFSPEATEALRLIDDAIGNQLRVFVSVSLAEFIALNPTLKKAQREQAWQQLYGETVDFVLCSPQDLKIRVAIVLADDSLSKADQRKQQQLWQALQATGLPIIDISPKAWPSASSLRDDILTACKAPSPVTVSSNSRLGQSRVEPVLNFDDMSDPDAEDEPQIKL